jgi:phosphoglycerate dehydrogenase-like enzyme
MFGAERVLAPSHPMDALAPSDAVVLMAALTPETSGMIGVDQLRAMGPGCWPVNVARDASSRATR